MRAPLHDEQGQFLPLLAIGMALVLLAAAALVVDVGHAMSVKRQLQAAGDAAALAGAQDLPDTVAATATARLYAAGGGKNTVPGADGLTTTVTSRCSDGSQPCTSPDVIAVSEQATVATTFAQVVGIDTFAVHASSTASHASSTAPLDIALVLDRTGSMSGQLGNLRAGAAAFLDALDPTLDQVALIVLPPVPSHGTACSAVDANSVGDDWYPVGSDSSAYLVDHLTSDFAKLTTDANCLKAGGSTSYKQALIAARDELVQNGRPGVAKAIVFETDGAANTVPDSAYAQPDEWLDLGGGSRVVTGFPLALRSDDVNRPCGSAVDYAASVAGDVSIYTVGYHLSSDQTCYQAPHRTSPTGSVGYKQVAESITASAAVQQIAAVGGGTSFLQEDGSKLAETFAAVAKQLSPARLVPDSP